MKYARKMISAGLANSEGCSDATADLKPAVPSRSAKYTTTSSAGHIPSGANAHTGLSNRR